MDQIQLQAHFYKNLSENQGKIFQIKSHPIKDTKAIGKEFVHWAMKEIPVTDTSFSKAPGYVRVNEEFNIPLQRLAPAEGEEMFYFERDAAVTKVVALNKAEYELITSIKAELDAAHDFIKEIVENKFY